MSWKDIILIAIALLVVVLTATETIALEAGILGVVGILAIKFFPYKLIEKVMKTRFYKWEVPNHRVITEALERMWWEKFGERIRWTGIVHPYPAWGKYSSTPIKFSYLFENITTGDYVVAYYSVLGKKWIGFDRKKYPVDSERVPAWLSTMTPNYHVYATMEIPTVPVGIPSEEEVVKPLEEEEHKKEVEKK